MSEQRAPYRAEEPPQAIRPRAALPVQQHRDPALDALLDQMRSGLGTVIAAINRYQGRPTEKRCPGCGERIK